jgi:hypothetical protein
MYQCAIDVLEAPRTSVSDFWYGSVSEMTTLTHPPTPFRPDVPLRSDTPFQDSSPMKRRADTVFATPSHRMKSDADDPFCVDTPRTPFIPNGPPSPSPVRSPSKRPVLNGHHSRATSSVYSVHSTRDEGVGDIAQAPANAPSPIRLPNSTYRSKPPVDHSPLPSQSYLSRQTARAERQWRLARFDLEIRSFVRLVRDHLRSVERVRAVMVARQENMRFVAANEKVLRSSAAQTMREWRGEVERGLGREVRWCSIRRGLGGCVREL